MHKYLKKKNAFTLVELLAVIVVLAVILLIAAPKIQTVIESSKKSSIEATTKVIADNAEMIYANKKLLDKSYNVNENPILCSEVAKISTADYSDCSIEFNNEGEATVHLKGAGTFLGYRCDGTSSYINCYQVGATSFETDSWETIKEVIELAKSRSNIEPEKDSELSKYTVGSTKMVSLDLNGNGVISDNENFMVRIANNSNYNCTLQSKTACGFVVEFVDSISGTRVWSNSESYLSDGWLTSDVRVYLMGTVLPKLEKSIGSNIVVDTNVISGTYSGTIETTDKLYLLSTSEVVKNGHQNDRAISSEITRQLDYYVDIDPILRIKNLNGTASGWWLRSYSLTSYKDMCFDVWTSGNVEQGWKNKDSNVGISPAFRLG